MAVKLTQLKLHYAWIVAGITFLALIVTAAVRATPGILIVPLEQEFGWSRSMISFAVSINLLLNGLIGPFAAGLLNRYGSRNVTLNSLAVLALGVALTTFIKSSWELVLLWGVLVGVGCGFLFTSGPSDLGPLVLYGSLALLVLCIVVIAIELINCAYGARSERAESGRGVLIVDSALESLRSKTHSG